MADDGTHRCFPHATSACGGCKRAATGTPAFPTTATAAAARAVHRSHGRRGGHGDASCGCNTWAGGRGSVVAVQAPRPLVVEVQVRVGGAHEATAVRADKHEQLLLGPGLRERRGCVDDHLLLVHHTLTRLSPRDPPAQLGCHGGVVPVGNELRAVACEQRRHVTVQA